MQDVQFLNIKVATAARLMGKSESFIRIGLQRNLLHFGAAVYTGKRWSYHIPAARFCEYMHITPERLWKEMQKEGGRAS